MDIGIDDSVRLTHDLPERELRRGDQGIVRSTWFAPNVAFEVEFAQPGAVSSARVVLLGYQIELAMTHKASRHR